MEEPISISMTALEWERIHDQLVSYNHIIRYADGHPAYLEQSAVELSTSEKLQKLIVYARPSLVDHS